MRSATRAASRAIMTIVAGTLLPASLEGDKVYLRAQSKVRKTAKSKRTFATYTLIQGVALK